YKTDNIIFFIIKVISPENDANNRHSTTPILLYLTLNKKTKTINNQCLYPWRIDMIKITMAKDFKSIFTLLLLKGEKKAEANIIA
ncbi:hypothetical protein AB4508_23630, partial [Vibrio splendidus]